MDSYAYLFLMAGLLGFTHAFEGDHLVAISSIVTRRENPRLALRDGVFWGLGHSSTILLVGAIIIAGQVAFSEQRFGQLEALVGVMLIGLGVYRLWRLQQHRVEVAHSHQIDHRQRHHLAYGVGLVHGLAGSGAMVLLVMTEIGAALPSLVYLLIFGLGSVIGMLVASGLFSLPFSRRLAVGGRLKTYLTLFSAAACLLFGGYILYEQWVG